VATKVSNLDRAVKLLKANPFMSVEDFTKKMKVKKPYAYVLRNKARALIPKANIEVATDNLTTTFTVPLEAGQTGTDEAVLPPQGELKTMTIPAFAVPSFLRADVVNHPPHYKIGGIETIDFIEAKGLDYNLGNVVKYVTRADHKGNKLQDLEKARWYLDRAISNHTDARDLV
jgi:hypothetical protein